MPYVPSSKTKGHVEKYGEDDREILDKEIHILAKQIAGRIITNYSIKFEYLKSFIDSALGYNELGKAIKNVSKKYGYEGAYLGELNYSITRLIQEVPQQMVKLGKWKEELRYWLYAVTVDSLISLANRNDLPVGVAGVFEDIKDEYKRRVNPAYEAVQIVKSGDCYDTPYHTVLVKAEGIDAVTGERVIGWQEIMVDFRKK
jgi:hypothetical protein